MSRSILATLAALVTLAVAQDFTVNTPTSVQACLPVSISWNGGVTPIFVSLIPGGQPGGNIIKDFGPQSTNALTWNVDQPAGTSLTVQIRDSSGKLNYSDKFTVQPSTQSCNPGSAGAAGAAGAAANTTGKPSASTPASTPAASTGKPDSSPPATGNSSASSTAASAGTSPTTSSTTNTAPTTGSSPASQAGTSDASRTIPGIVVSALAGALAIFA